MVDVLAPDEGQITNLGIILILKNRESVVQVRDTRTEGQFAVYLFRFH